MGASASLLTAVLLWVRERRRDVSDIRVSSSADNRAWAELFRQHSATVAAELDRERGERRKEEDAHTATRERLAAAEREIAVLKRDYAELAREVRRLGGHVPGDTPPGGATTGGTS